MPPQESGPNLTPHPAARDLLLARYPPVLGGRHGALHLRDTQGDLCQDGGGNGGWCTQPLMPTLIMHAKAGAAASHIVYACMAWPWHSMCCACKAQGVATALTAYAC